MPAYLFAVGDVVSLNFHAGQFIPKTDPFTVEALMPPVGTSLQYKIKCDTEAFRRVVAEYQLTPLDGEPDAPAHIAPVHPGEEN